MSPQSTLFPFQPNNFSYILTYFCNEISGPLSKDIPEGTVNLGISSNKNDATLQVLLVRERKSSGHPEKYVLVPLRSYTHSEAIIQKNLSANKLLDSFFS